MQINDAKVEDLIMLVDFYSDELENPIELQPTDTGGTPAKATKSEKGSEGMDR